MNKLLKKIYEEVICYENDTRKIDKILETEIQELLHPYAKQFSHEQIETILSLMYAIQLKAMQEGFQHGAKYTLSTLFALLSDS